MIANSVPIPRYAHPRTWRWVLTLPIRNGGERSCTFVALEASADLLVDYPALGVMATKCWLSGGVFHPTDVAFKAVDDPLVSSNLAVPAALDGIVSE